MLTKEDYRKMLNDDREAVFERRRELLHEVHMLEDLYLKDLGNTNSPKDTIDKFVDAVGMDEAVIVMASMINVKAWDGRIMPSNAEWAKRVEAAWDKDMGYEIGMYSNHIHTAHLDQLCDYMRRKAV